MSRETHSRVYFCVSFMWLIHRLFLLEVSTYVPAGSSINAQKESPVHRFTSDAWSKSGGIIVQIWLIIYPALCCRY